MSKFTLNSLAFATAVGAMLTVTAASAARSQSVKVCRKALAPVPFVLAGVVIAVGLLSSRPALAACVPDNFPNNWLQNQENAGGHTIGRHVGKTNQWLVNRYNNNYHISGASTYATVLTATQHILAALAITQGGYNAWEPNANIGSRRAMTTNLGYTVGSGVHTPTARPADVGDVENFDRLITVVEKTAAGACRLLTSYPTP